MKAFIALLSLTFVAQAGFSQTKKSFGGHVIPKEVSDFIAAAKANGALFYDVNETGKDGEPKYNPHVSTTEAEGPLTFKYTEITPDVLEKDLTSKEKGTIIDSYQSFECEQEDEQGNTVKTTCQEATYKDYVGGTGNISQFYDEAYHSDFYARGPQGQKWANNCAFLADGSLHCLPAMRRSESSGGFVLVNPDLSRGKLMIYNGHIDVQGGVVVSVEISGRIDKMAAKGKIKLIDPLDLLKAWGFKLAPGLTVIHGDTEAGVPQKDPVTGLFGISKEEAAKPPK